MRGAGAARACAARSTGLLGLLVLAVAVVAAGTARTDLGAERVARTGATGGAGERPNVVVIVADDMRYDDLRSAPHVRRVLQRGGVDLRNAFSGSPLCCPARASLLTGQLPHSHRVLSHEPPYGFAALDDSRTLATTLQEAGYRTGFVGKYLNGYGAQELRTTGEPSYTYVPPGWDAWRAAVERPGPWAAPGGTYDYFRTVWNVDGATTGTSLHGEYATDTTGRFAREVADGLAAGPDPFFLLVSFLAPHHGGPREPDDPADRVVAGRTFRYPTPAVPARVRDRFDTRTTRAPGLPATGSPDPDQSDVAWHLRRPDLDGGDRAAVLEVARQRAEAVRVLDEQVGALVAHLEASGELDDTVLVLTSDNGYFLGEHRVRGGKVLGHEPSLRVPLLVAGPGVPAGERRHAPVSTVDLAATVLDLAGATERHPLALEGRSAVPLLERDRDWDRAVVVESLLGGLPDRSADFTDARRMIGVRTARWSFLRYATGAAELYDLRADPDQLRNLAADPAHAEVRRALLGVWRRAAYCTGEGCQVPLPPGLAADVTGTRALTEAWWATVTRGR